MYHALQNIVHRTTYAYTRRPIGIATQSEEPYSFSQKNLEPSMDRHRPAKLSISIVLASHEGFCYVRKHGSYS
jgi:hypothetical protein